MKKIFTNFLLALAVIMTSQTLKAQLIPLYTFSSSAISYSAIIGGTVLGTNANDDEIFDNVPIGFNFNYGGTSFSQLSVCANGFLKFGVLLNSSSYNAISDNFGDDTIVAALSRDLASNTNGVLRYRTNGTAPNRIFIVQWRDYSSYSNIDTMNFQIRLFETSNRIEVHYGSFYVDVNNFYEVGLRGINANNEFNNRSVLNLTNTWATSTAGTLITDNCELDPGPPAFKPVNGQKYVWSPPPPCSGPPTAGTLTIPAVGTVVCIGTSINLNVTGSTAAFGITYQWQSSPNGVTWTSVASATNSGFSATYTAPVYYRRVIACGTNTVATNALHFITNSPVSNYAAVPFYEGFDNTWQNRCDVRDVPVTAFWTNSPSNGNNSWRRQDDGSAANWTSSGGTVTPFMGVGAANFNSTDAPNMASGNLDLRVNLGTAQTHYVSFYHSNDYGDDSLEVYFSTNGGTTFIKNAGILSGDYDILSSNGWQKRTYNLGAINSTSCVIRFKGISDGNNGYNDIGIDSLSVYNNCSGTPTAGAVSGSSIACTGQSVTLNVSGSTYAGGLTCQWQSSPNGITWTSIPSATTTAYSPTFTNTIYYRRILACGSSTAVTAGFSIVPTPSVTYATVPFLENFDNTWQDRCDLRNVPVSANWKSNPTTGDNSWRRQDDGVSANWTSSFGIVTPLAGIGSADFHTYDASIGTTGELDLYVNLGSTANYQMSFYHINNSGDDSLEIFLSTNGGNSFVKKTAFVSGDYSTIDANWNKKTISLGPVNSSSCVVRFLATSDYGIDDIGMDSLQIKTIGCAAPVVTLVASQPTVCSGAPINLIAIGAVTYTWNTTATTSSITVTPSVTTTYTVTGENGPGCANTKTITVNVTPGPSITFSASPGLTICPGGSANITASGATNYTWSVGSQTTAVINVTPTISQVYNIIGTNASGCSTSTSVTLFVTTCTGVNNNMLENAGNVSVYPNPTEGNIIIEMLNTGSKKIQIVDVTGRLVLEKSTIEYKADLNISHLAKGVYYVRVLYENTVNVTKIIKE